MASERRVIALRLDDATYEVVSSAAAAEMRTVSRMSELLLMLGLREFQKRGGFPVVLAGRKSK